MGFFRFLIVGCITAVVQFSMLSILLEILVIDYKLATSLAYITAVVFHFSANRYFTFQLDGLPEISQIFRYLVVAIVNFMITLLVTILSVEALGLGAYIGTILSILITIVFGYLATKHWVFIKDKTTHA